MDALLAPEAFVAAAARNPDAPALLIDDDVVSYAELDERVDRMSYALADRGARPGAFVALLLPRCADLVVAMHAVLRTGAAYVPLDPTHPIDRISYALDDSESVLVVTTSDIATRLPGRPCLSVDTTEFVGPPLPVETVGPEDAAYAIYTSGSTGRPKGVVVTHRGLHNLLIAMAGITGLAPGTRIVATTTVSFDIAVVELLLPLVCGATVVLARERTGADPAALISLIERSRAGVLQATPALWQTLVEERRGALRGLRSIVGGDSLPASLAAELRCCTAGVTNVYGPTESTVWSTAAQLTERPGPPPIGLPLRATTVHVLDERLNPVPSGVVGELYIGGAGLARGYLGRPALTASRFVANPFGERGDRVYRTGDLVRVGPDGQLEFLGRSDFQVKVNGHRIELGEIESVVAAADEVSGCVVTAHRNGDAPYLVAYVILERDRTPGVTRLDPTRAAALTERARRFLPAYMVPAVYLALEKFPLTLNGKVDRAALPDPAAVATHGRPPQDDDQIALCGLYADVLALPEVSIDDDFVRLGGGSVLAHTLIDRIRRTFDVEVPLPDLFTGPIGDLAARIRQFPAARRRIRPMRTQNPPADAAAVTAVQGANGTELVAHVAPTESASDPAVQQAHVQRWCQVWDSVYADADEAELRPDFAGWLSSYTGEPSPTEQMGEWLAHTVERIRAFHPVAVADVGVGVGLIMRSLVEQVSEYHGIDLSAAALRSAASCLGSGRPLPDSARLVQSGPEYLRQLPAGGLDLVVVNSVAQYFPSLPYLRAVLRDAAHAVGTDGAVFIGDVRSLELLPEFYTSVQLARADALQSAEELRSAVSHRALEDRELCVSPSFFHELAADLPGLSKVRIELKRGWSDNELTQFRYDVSLLFGTETDGPAIDVPARRLPYPELPEGLAGLTELLAESRDGVLVRGIPNQRLDRSRAAVRELAALPEDATAWDLQRVLWEADTDAGVHPERIHEIADKTGRHVRLLVPADGSLASFDAVFEPASDTDERGNGL